MRQHQEASGPDWLASCHRAGLGACSYKIIATAKSAGKGYWVALFGSALKRWYRIGGTPAG